MDAQIWDTEKLEASCNEALKEWDPSPSAHAAPDPLCSCGIHAWKTRSSALTFQPVVTAVGEVRLWGSVLEAEHGYRAQHAELAGELEVLLPCHVHSEDCDGVVGVAVETDGFKPYCGNHQPDARDTSATLPLDSFLYQLEDDLQQRYDVAVLPVR